MQNHRITLRLHRYFLLALLLSGVGLLAFGLTRLNWRADAAPQNTPNNQSSPDGIWQASGTQSAAGVRGQAHVFQLSQTALTSVLNRAPREYAAPLSASTAVITLPLPDGTFGRFQIEDSPAMEPALAAKFPEIKSYRGAGLDDRTATMRCDFSPAGFNALVLSAAGAFNVRPISQQDKTTYLVVAADDQVGQAQCSVNTANLDSAARPIGPTVAIGPTRKNYRMAIATTGEYTANYGPDVPTALASVNTWLNGANVVFERDIGAHFNLVANNNLIIFTNAGTDGLTNSNESTMLNEIVPILDAQIGNANYDIGHALGLHSTPGSSGGVASLASVCSGALKGRGATRVSGAAGNGSALGVLTHEFGHQFNANHSFNGTVNFCNQKNNATSWESGGGSTLMSYTGICQTDNITSSRDLRFHSGSYGEAQAWLAGGTGASCGAPVATGNTAPTLNSGGNFTIPKQTPFTLTAVGNDADPTDVPNLTYTWEQLDAGGATFPQNGTAASYNDAADPMNTTRPIFRAFPPTASPARTFPSLTYILNNANVPPDTVGGFQTAEQLPRRDRTLNFRATVRDNRGGVNEANAVITVATTGPLAVTSPNGANNITGGAATNVTWNVNGTNAQAADVKISLSTDGGNTFPTVLAPNTPNDGSQSVTFPNALLSSTARVKIEAVSNIFFDISDANFNLTPGDGCPAVSNINPLIINTGGQVVLTGINFTSVSAVNFTGANVNCPSANCTVNNNTQITLTVPAGATTGPLTIVKAGCTNLQTAALTICPNPPTTLLYDGGAPNSAFSGPSYFVIRATPASYPATLGSVLLRFDAFQGIGSGSAIGVLTGANPSGSTNINGVSLQTTNATVGTLSQFVTYPVTPITINSGDFVVGFFYSGGGFPGAHDSSPTANRSFSSGNGTNFDAAPGDLLIRANVFTGNCGGGPPACPTVTNLNPTSGAVGSQVTITGTNFTGVTGVKFSNNVTAAFNVVNATTITATVPAGAVTGPITLSKTGCADVNTGTFTVTAPPACPTVTNINPTAGAVGSPVTITGTNFTGVNAVRFTNNVNAPNFNVDSATQISVFVPLGAATGPITISKPGCNDVNTATFTVVSNCPTITNINPTSGAVGSQVVITGSNYTGDTEVRFSNNVVAFFTTNSSTQITATVPAGAVTGPISIRRLGDANCPTPATSATFTVTGADPCTNFQPIAYGQTINGVLQAGDCTTIFGDGSFSDLYTFNGTAGDQISIALNSAAFDAYLELRNAAGTTVIASDNNGGGGTNARIPATNGFFTLPTTAVYRIVANTFVAAGSGAYALTLSVSNPCITSVTVNTVTDAADAVPGNGVCETAAGNGVCTLRAAIQEANALPACTPFTINFSVNGIFNLGTALPNLDHPNLTINGPGANLSTVRRNAASLFRIFTNNAGRTATLSGLTISNGDVGGGDTGGGVKNSGTLTITNCTINGGNHANGGGGLFNVGTLTMTGSTISGNFANFDGGGLYNSGNATATLTNCTISGNTGGTGLSSGLINAAGAGQTATLTLTNCTVTANTGGAYAMDNVNFGGATTVTTQLRNTLVAANSGTNFFTPRNNMLTSLGNNLDSDGSTGFTNGVGGNLVGTAGNPLNALLDALAVNGGPTLTHALLPGSPAINAGTNTGAPATDQRGIARPQLATTDIGAYESRGFTLAILSGNNQTTTINTPFANALIVSVNSANGEPVNGGRVTFSPPGAGQSCTLTNNPATITGGQASVMATANGTVGSYNVGVNASGLGGDFFILTNNAADGIAPTATLSAANVTTGGATTYTFTITYSDNVAINVSTLGNGDAQVSGPGGFNMAATFVSVNNNSNGTPRTATYSITPPGGTWDNSDNGTYTVTMNTNQVADTAGNFVAAGALGAFTVTINPGGNGLQFYPLPNPVRLLDTRAGAAACSQPSMPITANTSLTQVARSFCGIPANATALTGNVTTVNSGGGFLTLYPSDATQPTVANSNFNPNEIINNVFTVGLGANDGAFKIFALTTTHVVVDVTGYYAPPATGGLYFHPLPAPVRLLETRTGQPVGCFKPGVPIAAGGTLLQQGNNTCGIPASAQALVGNATSVTPGGPGFLTLFPNGAAQPLIATSNYNGNDVVNGPFTVGLGTGGQFKIFTQATTHLVVDVLGYFSTEATDANGPGLFFRQIARPVRLLETRTNPPNLPGCIKPGIRLQSQTTVYNLVARDTCDGINFSMAQAIVGNATVVGPDNGGFMTLFPFGQAQPTTATSNFNAGGANNRHFFVGLDAAEGKFNIFFNMNGTQFTTDLVIDVSGYFAP